jgi:hypothetical protein
MIRDGEPKGKSFASQEGGNPFPVPYDTFREANTKGVLLKMFEKKDEILSPRPTLHCGRKMRPDGEWEE